LLFFTWNLSKSVRAFRLALDHLANLGGPFIASLQELPASANSTAKAEGQALALSAGRVRCLGVASSARSHGRVGLFSSPDCSASNFPSDSHNRLIMAPVRAPRCPGLQIVGLHSHDRLTFPKESERPMLAQTLRRHIDSFWDATCPLVIMGDFNADPYDPEVSARAGLYAVRDREETDGTRPSVLADNPAVRPLYNPMWQLLPEDRAQPGGTLYIDDESRGIRWRIYDQIVVSPNLIPKLHSPPAILSSVGGTNLLGKYRHPAKGVSAHLPVQLSITF
jgi:exonuclease III